MAHIIMLGNAIDGLDLIGPFSDLEDALDYVHSELDNKDKLDDKDWHIVELTDPNGDDADRPKGMDRVTYGHLKARAKL